MLDRLPQQVLTVSWLIVTMRLQSISIQDLKILTNVRLPRSKGILN